MKIYTMSVIVGDSKCNASCKFCISKTTFSCEVNKSEDIDPKVAHNFQKACICAEKSGVQTILLTGKGEPTLYPREITNYLLMLEKSGCKFPFIELQTNGIVLDQSFTLYEGYLREWYNLGLTTIALSVVHWEYEKNRSIYQPNGKYMDMGRLIRRLKNIGFSVRVCCMMLNGYVDDPEKLEMFISMCKINSVEQFTARPIHAPGSYSLTASAVENQYNNWIMHHGLPKEKIEKIEEWTKKNCTPLLQLPFGAVVYDYEGQNYCLSNCLTESTNVEEMRQIIFYPDGHLRYSWKYKGAVLL